MTQIEIEKIDAIYKLYGYSKKTYQDCIAYEYKQGRYFGADIVALTDDANKIKEISQSYSTQGYSVKTISNTDIEYVKNDLFESFFHLKLNRLLIKKKYEEFAEKQIEGLPSSSKYEYIQSPYNYILTNSEGELLEYRDNDDTSVIDTIIEKIRDENRAVLVIIEAAAGYGKTCAAYEIINNIQSDNEKILPFYIELSRNREARIFKHILQNEIENQFQNVVTSEVVLYQIIEGKIPVIIDGFDELLSKNISDNSLETTRDVESMLVTIGNLLKGKAKIIITSRKTAIFSGLSFYEKMNTTGELDFDIARFTISEPNIEDWLNKEQLDILNLNNFPIENIANPVLLSYVRNMDIEELKELVIKEKTLVDTYFDFLLNREQLRQEIKFTNEEQLRILKKLVRLMVEFNIKSEEKGFIKELIKEYNVTLFNEYIKNYPKYPKPTHEDLAETLSNHALLDRKNNDNIGFINEFIFGVIIAKNLVGENFSKHYKNLSDKNIPADFAYLALTAYKVQSDELKQQLWSVFYDKKFFYSFEFLFYRDVLLQNKLMEKQYENIEIDGYIGFGVEFKESKFINSIFSNCKFISCEFDSNIFDKSGFINCYFNNCKWINVDKDFCTSCYINGSKADNNFIDLLNNIPIIDITVEKELEEKILGKFFVSNNRARRMLRISSIKEGFSNEYTAREIDKTLNNLRKENLVFFDGDICYIQREGINYFNKKCQI